MTVPQSRRLLRNSVCVSFPINVLYDFGAAVTHVRRKRLSHTQHSTSPEINHGSDKKKFKASNSVHPGDYTNVLDYLEAKYVQGISLNTEKEVKDEEEGQGSVYSESSFLDDTDLQRNVAGQVMSHVTATTVTLGDDKDDYFVNIGNLEVEENELTQLSYDPLSDIEGVSKKRVPKKTSKGGPTQKQMPKESGNTSKQLDTESKRTTEADVEEAKAKYERLYSDLLNQIRSATVEQLPRRKSTTERVSVTVPDGVSPGDSLTFSNPHIAGQKLKVVVPLSCKQPGAVFKVTVPVNAPPSDGTDHNKLQKSNYDVLDSYARAYDEWCNLRAKLRRKDGEAPFAAHFEKRKKFDKLVEEVPQGLMTPLDKAYFQKLLRRVRQSKSKRVEQVEPETETLPAAVAPALGKTDVFCSIPFLTSDFK